MLSPVAQAQDLKELRFGVLPVPSESPEELSSAFQAIADAVGKQLNVPAKVFVSPSYNALIEGLGANRLDVAFVGGEQYVLAREQGIALTPLVQVVHSGRNFYKSQVIVRADSPIRRVEDLKAKTFAFVSPSSASGGLAPLLMLERAGVKPADLKRALYTGNHEASFLAVKNGKVDAAGVADQYWNIWKKAGLVNFGSYDMHSGALQGGDIRIVQSLDVPEAGIVARDALGQAMLERMRAALVAVPKSAFGDRGFVGNFDRFVASSDSTYEPVRAMRKLISSQPKRN
jgi:phosphonate transport system substrate-binding protein